MKILNTIFTEKKIRNGLKVRIANEGTANAEICIYDEIGKDPWNDTGIDETDIANAIKEIPTGTNMDLRVNSFGGCVVTGFAIFNRLKEFPGQITAYIDGIAASTASWIPLAADKIIAPKTSQMFIHDALCFTMGNADSLRKDADNLDTTSNQIAEMYAKKTGKSVAEMRDLMKAETLLTGQAAKDLGLVDEVTDIAPTRNFSSKEIEGMKNILRKSINKIQPPIQKNKIIMNRDRIIKLLNKLGIKFNAADTDEALAALLDAHEAAPVAAATPQNVIDLEAKVKSLEEKNKRENKTRIENLVRNAVIDDKIPGNHVEAWIARIEKDDGMVEVLNSLPANRPGSNNLPVSRAELVGEAFADIQNFVLNNGPRLTNKFVGPAAGNVSIDKDVRKDIFACAQRSNRAIKKHIDVLKAMFNTNTIDPVLQRTVIMAEVMLRAFKVQTLPVRCFTHTFSNVPLEGTDYVAVPYFPLQTAASQDWDPAVGYASAGDTVENMRRVQVNKRKFQELAFSSYELNRQPYQNWEKLGLMNAEKLGVDVNADILSMVTNANFGAPGIRIPAAAFSADDVANLFVIATNLNWPQIGRSLILGASYKGALIKDPSFKSALNYGDSDAIRKAEIKSIYGFEDIFVVPDQNLPGNAENLTGFICQENAGLVATAPIMPAPAVRALMVRYDMAVDADDGTTIEYKLFGDTILDKTREVVESNYGYAPGVQTALVRIVSQ